eukprot:m.161736 g.161736  ORF g.161736 m.161736 type:complete len:939 (+) comp16381_c0_seq2:1676-4492(+)
MGNDKKLDRKLYDAVKAGKYDTVKQLLDMGADPNAPVGKKGMTCMFRAVQKSHANIEELLMQRGGTLHSSSTLARGLQAMFDADQESKSSQSQTTPPPQSLTGSIHSDTMQDQVEQIPVSPTSPTEYLEPQQVLPEPEQSTPDSQPNFSRMSSLADGIRSSVRRKSSQPVAVPIAGPVTPEPAWTSPLGQSSIPTDGQWEFDRSKLKQVRKLGEGHFGVVFEGEAIGIIPNQTTTRVAVKMLSDTSAEAKDDFLKEVQIMTSIAGSEYIVRLLGICTKEQPFLMIMELMPNGDLKTLLRESRPKASRPAPFSMRRLVSMGADVAEGMTYLQSIRVVHRDLAARNCLVNEEWRVKIGDFGLTRDVYAGEYYRMTGSTPLPVRWMAPEAIEDGVYTTQSDTWAFGIVLWELVTFAKMPYAGLSNLEVVERVAEQNYRMPQPKECPDELYHLMLDCWNDDPESRPAFDELRQKLRKFAEEVSDAPLEKARRQSRSEPERQRSHSTLPVSSIPEAEERSGHKQPMADAYVDMNGPSPRDNDSDEDEGPKIQTEEGVSYIANPTGDDSIVYMQTVAEKYPTLSSIELAIKVAKDQSAVENIRLSQDDREVKMSDRVAVEESGVTSATNTLKTETEPTEPEQPRKGRSSVSAMKGIWAEHTERARQEAERTNFPTSNYRQSSPSPKPNPVSPAPVEVDQKGAADTTVIQSNSPAKTSSSFSTSLNKIEKKAKPKYGGATTWVTAGVPLGNHIQGMLPQSRQREAERMTSVSVPEPEQTETRYSTGARPAFPVMQPVPQPPTNELLISDKDFLANDFSETAAKAQQSMFSAASKAEREMEKWIEAVIGDYVSGSTLQEVLASGEVLCQLMNKIQPGSVSKYHQEPRLAFKKMENIGYFLDAAKRYGLPDSDLFITVDLFESQNMKQVVICLGALKKIAESRGLRL